MIRVLIIIFWGVTLLSAIYLRTAVYSTLPSLISSSLIDVLVLFLLSTSTHFYLNLKEHHPLFTKGLVLFLFVLVSLVLRYFSEGLFMGFGFGFNSDVSVKFLFTKLITSIIIAGVTVAYHILEKYNEVQEQKMRTELDKKQLELDYLQSRVNPHFLFNTLGSIHSLAMVKSDQTAPMIEELSDLMRYMFYDCQQDFILLEKEIQFIENYIHLNQLKSQKPLDVKFTSKLTNEEYKIPPLLFICFIENAFKHGNIMFGGNITIELVQNELGVSFSCKNSFEKTTIKSASKQSGFGLMNIKKRLSYLYPNKHVLTIKSETDYLVGLKII